jgi:hypothetical protein
MPGTTAGVIVFASAPGLLNAWLDFNRNGSWADQGEQIFTNVLLVAGPNPLSFPVPAWAVPGPSFARFRFSNQGGLSYTGLAPDGEVEDYAVDILEPLDFGDAPDPTYPTWLASNGARHTIVPGFFLGASVDAELNGQPNANATGDDLAGIDDEDGVAFTTAIMPGTIAGVNVAASGPGGLLSA